MRVLLSKIVETRMQKAHNIRESDNQIIVEKFVKFRPFDNAFSTIILVEKRCQFRGFYRRKSDFFPMGLQREQENILHRLWTVSLGTDHVTRQLKAALSQCGARRLQSRPKIKGLEEVRGRTLQKFE